jgi:hypothetical protein
MFKEMLNETIKVSEDSLEGAMKQISFAKEGQETATEVSTTQTEEKAIEITPELVDELIKKIPELEGIDPTKLLNGIQVEMEHIALVGNNVEAIARIAADHIKEFPEADYYAALSTMEAGLVPPPVEEVPAEEAPKEEELEKEVKEEEKETPKEQAEEEIVKKEEVEEKKK